jgi:hypothetical protein
MPEWPVMRRVVFIFELVLCIGNPYLFLAIFFTDASTKLAYR